MKKPSDESISVSVIFAVLCFGALLGASSLAWKTSAERSTVEPTAARAPPPEAPHKVSEMPPTNHQELFAAFQAKLDNDRTLAEMEAWWKLTHDRKHAPAKKATTRAPSAPPIPQVIPSHSTYIIHATVPETPQYLSDTTRWPVHSCPLGNGCAR